MSADILVTGCLRGLGAFLTRELNAVGLHRNNTEALLNSKTKYRSIYHCAFSSARSEQSEAQNLLLLKKLSMQPHDRFIFISSCDVYPDNGSVHNENEPLDALKARSAYARDKILCEQFITENCNSPLIIRPTGLLGSDISKNLRALMFDETPRLTLTADSRWNFVTYAELKSLATRMDSTDFIGPINLARTESVKVSEFAASLKKSPVYGEFHYEVPELENTHAQQILPQLALSSLQLLLEYKEEMR